MSTAQQRVNRILEDRMRNDIEKYGIDFFKIKKLSYEYVPNECQKKFIIDTYKLKYENGVSVGKRFGKSSTWINKRLKTWGIPIKSSKELYQLLDYNEDYFEIIDTEEKAYWLGMLFADGTVTYNKLDKQGKRKNRIKLSLQSSDVEHLKLFASQIDYQDYSPKVLSVIVEGKEYNYCDLSLSSTKMIKDLMDKGMIITNNQLGKDKKELIRLPTEEQVPSHLLKHFVRGYFDGDGSLTRQRVKGKVIDTQHYTFKFASNKVFCEQLKEFFDLKELEGYSEETSNVYKVKDKKYLYTFEAGGNHRVYHIYNKMYKDANIYLKRKKERIDEYLSYFDENNIFTTGQNRPLHHYKRVNNKTNKLIFK